MNGKNLKRAALAVALGVSLAAATGARAQDALLNKLVEKGYLSQREANDIREQLGAETAANVEAYNKQKVSSWIDEMKWSSDLRLRAEYFDNEDQSNTNDRWRFRYRLRLGLDIKFQEWAKIGLRLASGGDDPVSTNQTMQDTLSRKTIGIDLAYVMITPPMADWLAISGGKINNPIWQTTVASPLQYDYDVTPEGAAEQVSLPVGDKNQYRLFANFGQFVLDEIGTDANDPFLFEFQGGAEARFGADPKSPVVKATVAGGYSMTHNLAGMAINSSSQPTGAALPDSRSTSPNRGNATSQPGGAGTTLFYLDEFEVINARAELEWKLSNRPFARTPAVFTFSGEWLKNLNSSYDNLGGSTQTIDPDQTEGWTAGVAFGKAKKTGEWLVSYQYKYLEADAVWDATTDSDWGLGGTDRKGHVFKGAYNIRDWWQLGFTAFLSEKISDRPNSGENTRGLAGENLLRIQMDTVFKF